jgi:hypothetical protein
MPAQNPELSAQDLEMTTVRAPLGLGNGPDDQTTRESFVVMRT